MSTLFGDLHWFGWHQESGMVDTDVVTTRRLRLLACVTENYGTQAECVRKTGIHQGELSGLLKSKSFGEKKARTLEAILGLPNLWLDGLDVQDVNDIVADFAWVYANADDRGKALLHTVVGAVRAGHCNIKDKKQA